MKQATQPGFYAGENGIDVFIPAGTVRADNHPDVSRVDAGWRDLSEEETGPQEVPPSTEQAPKRPRRGM